MGLTSLPTIGTGQPLGPTKSDARTATDLTRELASSEWNAAAVALKDVCAEVGLANGTTPGSLVALLAGLGGAPVATSKVWAPTVASVTNLDVTPTHTSKGLYARLGPVAVFGIRLTVDPTAAAATEFTLTPPISLDLTSDDDAIGVVTGAFESQGRINVDAVGDKLRCLFTTTSAASHSVWVIGVQRAS